MNHFNRRQMMALLVGTSALALTGIPARALEVIDYTGPELDTLAASGQPYLVNFFATWCSTCAAQQRVLDDLTGESEAYRAIPILRVDWDTYGNGDLARSMEIPRRSTLVMMRGTTELGRLVADTRRNAIAGLLDLAAS